MRLVLTLLLAGLPLSTGAQSLHQRPQIAATRVEVPPRIDGVLDDPAWDRAPVLSGFIQQLPNEGAPDLMGTAAPFVMDRSFVVKLTYLLRL